MDRTALIDEIRQIGDYVSRREMGKMEKGITKDFNFVSASLSHFLPGLDQDEHPSFYLEMMRHRSLAVLHSDLPQLVHKMSVRKGGGPEKGQSPEDSRKAPFVPVVGAPMIYCGYHLGSYRAIIGYMVRENLNFGLLLDKRTFLEQGDAVRQSIQELRESTGKEVQFTLFNAEDPLSLVAISKWMRDSNPIVAYIDGNTGYGGLYNEKESLFMEMELFGHPIKCRKGIALLSYLMQVPIVPAISYFENQEDAPILEIHAPICPWNSRETKEQYMQRANQALFQILEEKLARYPSQWEAWLYVHKFIPARLLKEEALQAANDADAGMLCFNKKGFGLFKMGEKAYLFNRTNYSSFEIPPALFDILEELRGRHSFGYAEAGLSTGNLSTLIRKNILSHITPSAK